MQSIKCVSLSDGQLICLELISQNLTSKEIGARLGISRHTVDQRVRGALRVLGVVNRRQAARLFQGKPHSGQREWQSARDNAVAPLIDPDDQSAARSSPNFQLPFATAAQPTNAMGVWQRLLWIVTIAAIAAFSGFIYLAGLESLARLSGPSWLR